MQASTINLDVLDHIMGFSNRKALLNMMLASRDLHHSTIKHLLRDVPKLTKPEMFKSFLYFCDAGGQTAETAHRMIHLRGLALDLVSSYRDKAVMRRKLSVTAQALVRFFNMTVRPYAHNFTRLSIFDCRDLLENDGSGLSAAISSLTTLTYLRLHNATERAFWLLHSLQSRLVEVDVDIHIDKSQPPAQDLTALFRHSVSSLTVVSLYYTSSPTGVACYQLVHTLDACRLPVPITRDYIATFPNLQVLRASECVGRHQDDDDWTRCRDLNVAQQARDNSWRSLRGYVGSILFLYLLGLPCHVTYVHVCDDEHELMDFRQVRAVVNDTHPEHLKIHVYEVPPVLEQADDIVALCGSAEFQAVKTFQLDLVSVHPGHDNTDMEAMLECIFAAISSNSCLVGFALNIKWSLHRGGIEGGTALGWGATVTRRERAPSRAQVFLASLDIDSVADRLLGSCESLQAVQITLNDVTVKRGPSDVFFDEKTL